MRRSFFIYYAGADIFSNTIMNYSLPEVATEYVQRGTITEKVRGTGTITASDPYNVSISESRVISSVAVKAGDEVKKATRCFIWRIWKARSCWMRRRN